MQVTIFKNINNERNPSMHLYAEAILEYMPSNVKGFGIDAFKLPLFEYYFTKEFIYPKIAARNQSDVNHITDHSYCGLLRRLAPERTVVTCHDLIPLLYPKTVSKAGKMRYFFNVKLLPKAKRIITCSEFTRETIIQIFGKDLENKIRIIPYGVRSIFKPIQQKDILRNKYNIKRKSIMHVGSSYRHKNVEIILKFLKTHKEFQFVKIGPFLPVHRRYIRMDNLQKQVLHFPYIDLAHSYKISEIYNSVGCLVMPSFYEGFGLPILEAMACACPVICSEIPPFREIARDAAVFFDQNSLESFGTALRGLFNEEALRTKIVKNGLSTIKGYSWSKCAERTYKVYEEIYRQT